MRFVINLNNFELINLNLFQFMRLKVSSDEPDKLFRMIKLECRANDQAVLNSYETFAVTAASHLGIQIEKV